jgi:2-polyprenyl-3-methyl-5-hydroxy-6-metoxy-1,4-benzoquinol methylase
VAEPARKARELLLVPAGGHGEGMGHLVRCLRLARGMGGGSAFHPGWLDASALRTLRERLARFPEEGRPRVIDPASERGCWDIVLVDKRRTTGSELAALGELGMAVLLDEGGEARRSAPYLVDALPRLPGGDTANAASLSYLGLRVDRRRKRNRRGRRPRRVLVSFGGEDAPDLTGTFLRTVIGRGLLAPKDITVVVGSLFADRAWPGGVRVLRGVKALRPLFTRHDLLVTHFGMAALEALAAGMSVVLFNPTAYHRSLARGAGIPEIGVRRVRVRTLRDLLADPRQLAAGVEHFQRRLADCPRETLAEHLGRLSGGSSDRCPACGGTGAVIGRFPLRTYRHCHECRIDYLQSFGRPARTYGKGYFFEEYRAQYGRTYLEDVPSIEAAGRSRIALIERALGRRMAGRPRGIIVDVGCAYGPFLTALRDAGWPCFGIDVSEDAVEHVRKILRLPAACLPFERLERRHVPGARIEAVTLWYVIEHLEDLDGALRRLAGLLGPGAVLAFSTPNGRGISSRSSRRSFLEASPSDHRTILRPAGLRRLLARYGFRLARIRVTGHHPERFPGLAGRLARSGRSGQAVVRAASRLVRLGDTFEAYAVRTA